MSSCWKPLPYSRGKQHSFKSIFCDVYLNEKVSWVLVYLCYLPVPYMIDLSMVCSPSFVIVGQCWEGHIKISDLSILV